MFDFPGFFVVAGTGSRSCLNLPAPQRTALKNALVHEVEALKGVHPKLLLVSGMAEGWDEFIARTAILLDIPFAAIIPSPNYADYYWRDHSIQGKSRIESFNKLKDAAIHFEFVRPDHYGANRRAGHANFDRNQRMVDISNHFLVHDPASAGTRDCVRRIIKAKKTYKEIS